MGSIKTIITGWAKNWGVIPSSQAEVKLSELRLSICTRCNLSAESKLLEIINGHGQYVKNIYCTHCKCPCKPKSLVWWESCPVGKW